MRYRRIPLALVLSGMVAIPHVEHTVQQVKWILNKPNTAIRLIDEIRGRLYNGSQT